MNIRLHLFEFEDFPWFPHVVREGMLDFLRFMITKLGAYEAAVPLLQELLLKTQQRHITDLCSGAGGGIAGIQQALAQQMQEPVLITLTDLYPNISSYQYLQAKSNNTINFVASPVDATSVPESIKGVRTIFSSFHHLKPEQAQAVLQDAADKSAAIGIFEGASKSWLELLALWLAFPAVIFLVTPFIHPFKLSRLFFTYLIPIIPFGIVWDGTVSLLRIYTPKMLESMAAKVSAPHYRWRMGKAGSRIGKHVIYIIGYPDHQLKTN
ncbi:class I SAM-dependent methyltransferase [Pontibacter silvestris]|uniref:Class I SAM-dependent methyltransferase n=1 Tax=Pontibacter silvestris TaxID=2305183 RepID=A0ABW4X436_9BACT|nr:class I SAM-dependent methyltransferase [Pontibacter silvestris]MCC9137925.1 class I SAM-dependent methyltransferase [Pontibacter silvestris]